MPLCFSGLFNVSDKALIAYSILLEWRAGFKRGMPINLLIESKLEVLGKKAGEVCITNHLVK